MMVISPASRLPVIQDTPSSRQPAPQREAVADTAGAPAALARRAAPLPSMSIDAEGEHTALAHYRAVQHLPTDGTEVWIGRIDTWV